MATITLTGTFLDATGDPVSGRATFTPVLAGPSTSGNIVAEPIPAAIVNGALSVVLTTTDTFLYTQGQVSYRAYIRTGSTRETYYIVLPSTLGSTVDIASLIRYEIPPDVVIDVGGGVSSDPEVAQLQGKVDTLESTVAALEAQITALSGSISSFTSDIAAINTELGSNPSGSEVTVAARLDLAEASITSNDADRVTDILSLTTRVTTAEASLGNARLFSGTTYPPTGYTAQNGDVFVDTTGL